MNERCNQTKLNHLLHSVFFVSSFTQSLIFNQIVELLMCVSERECECIIFLLSSMSCRLCSINCWWCCCCRSCLTCSEMYLLLLLKSYLIGAMSIFREGKKKSVQVAAFSPPPLIVHSICRILQQLSAVFFFIHVDILFYSFSILLQSFVDFTSLSFSLSLRFFNFFCSTLFFLICFVILVFNSRDMMI